VRLHAAAWAVLIFIAACGQSLAGGDPGGDDYGGGADAGGAGTPECYSSSECPVGWTCSEFGTCVPPTSPPSGDAGVPPPPEIEYDISPPASSLHFVWVAMTELDALARIDGTSLEVHSVAVGDRPKVLATMPGTDTAVVLDQSNGAATVVRAAVGGDATEVYRTLPHLNRIAASRDGRYAVAFFDLARAIAEAGSLEGVGELGSFQDVTVLSVEPGHERPVDLTVGFKPRDVQFDAAGARAYVVTDDGVSIIDLAAVASGAPTIVPPVPVTDDPLGDASGVEVNVVASGDYAVVRTPGLAQVRVVRLTGPDAGTGWNLALPSMPTDIDVAPDGQRVYAVMRDPAGLAVIDVPGDALDPSGITLVDLAGASSGSLTLSADGRRGLLYTNATLDERITVIDLVAPGFPRVTRRLEKSVRAVAFDPTGAHAIIVHARAPGDPGDATTVDEVIDRSPGYSSFDVASGFAKLQITPVDPGAFTFAPGAPRAYLILDGGDADGATAAVQEVRFDSGVIHTTALSSPPEAVGILPGQGASETKVFVSQRHPLGRVTFIDVTSGQVRTLTGFDLNSRVID